MLPDRVSNPGPLTYESGALPIVLRGPAHKHNEDGRTAPDMGGNGSVPLSHSGNVVTRIGIHTYTHNSYVGGAPGVVDRVFTVHAGSRGVEVDPSTPTDSTCLSDFFDPVDQDIHTQCTMSWKIVVHTCITEWRSVIAVSLNVGGGFRLIKLAKLYMCMQTHYKHDEDGRTAPCVRGYGSAPLSHSGNVVTRTGLHS